MLSSSRSNRGQNQVVQIFGTGSNVINAYTKETGRPEPKDDANPTPMPIRAEIRYITRDAFARSVPFISLTKYQTRGAPNTQRTPEYNSVKVSQKVRKPVPMPAKQVVRSMEGSPFASSPCFALLVWLGTDIKGCNATFLTEGYTL